VFPLLPEVVVVVPLPVLPVLPDPPPCMFHASLQPESQLDDESPEGTLELLQTDDSLELDE
jgi:hypothetical protein